jgi:hypothetical protein
VIRELAPRHAFGHHHVREHEVDALVLRLPDRQRGHAVRRVEHRVAAAFEHHPGEHAHRRFIFDQQDRLLAAAGRFGDTPLRDRRRPFVER